MLNGLKKWFLRANTEEQVEKMSLCSVVVWWIAAVEINISRAVVGMCFGSTEVAVCKNSVFNMNIQEHTGEFSLLIALKRLISTCIHM